MYSVLRSVMAVGIAVCLSACGGGGDGGGAEVLEGKQATYTINGRVSGLSSTSGQPAPSLVLTNQRTDGALANRSVTVTGNGTFTFGTAPANTPFELAITSRPLGHGCQVRNGNGIVSSSSLSEIEIECIANTYSIGGNVWGLGTGNPGLRLRNGVDMIDITGDGPFSLLPLANNTDYNVQVEQAHSHYVCEVANQIGRINTADVSNIVVSCAAPIRISVTGFAPNDSDLVLTNTYPNDNGAQVQELLAISADGVYEFREALPRGRPYNVRIPTPHADYVCTVANGAGTVGIPAITLAVTCTLRTYAIGGTINGLGGAGANLVLGLVSPGLVDEQLPVTPTGSSQQFSFPTALPRGASFDVIEVAEPDSRICTFATGGNTTSGTVINRAPITNITINCIEPDPLSVTSVNIAAGADDVAFTAQPSVEFSATIDTNTVNSASISLQGPYGTHPVGYTVAANRVTLVPNSRLLPSVQYQLTVTPTLRGTNKQRIQSSYVVPFTTASGWGAPEVAGSNVVNPISPPVLRFSDTALAVTWIDHGLDTLDSNLTVSANNSTAVSHWGTPQSITAQTPILDSGSIANGDATFTWSQRPEEGSVASVIVSRYVPSTNQWRDHTVISNNAVIGASPRTALRSNGDILTVWMEWSEIGNQYYSRYFSHANQSWSSAQDAPFLTNTTTWGFNLSGDAMFLYSNFPGPGFYNIVASRFLTQSNTWVSEIVHSDVYSGQTTIGPSVGMRFDSEGNALALWLDLRFGLVSKRFTRSIDRWDTDARVIPNSMFPSTGFRFHTRPNGSAIAVWRQGSGLLSSRIPGPGETWSAPIRIDTSTSVGAFETVADSDGNVVAVWSQGEPGSYRLHGSRFSASQGTWDLTPQPISLVGNAADQIRTAIDSLGNRWVVWIQDGRVYVTRYDKNFNSWSQPYLLATSPDVASRPSVSVNSDGNAFVGWFQSGNVLVRRSSF